jgi:hypothetical protein
MKMKAILLALVSGGICAAGLLLAASGAEAWSPYGTYGSKGGWDHRRVCVPYKECSGCPPGAYAARCTVHTASCGVKVTLIRC